MSHSYSYGTFATIDLIKSKPAQVECVLIHDKLDSSNQDRLKELCKSNNIEIKTNVNKVIERVRDKESCNVIGVLKKYDLELEHVSNHIVLVNPSDMGNLGTIIRTCLGFGISNIAIITPAADIFHPKVIRASMGAVFQVQFKYYSDFETYKNTFINHVFYPFMLDGGIDLKTAKLEDARNYSLIFGNESSGLDPSYSNIGTSIFIRHNHRIDSLNLAMAVGIAAYEFNHKQ